MPPVRPSHRDAAPPLATYRLQLNADFGFNAVAEVVPYLAGMGFTHLYLSPVFAAKTGSAHGYDVTDPTRLNPELGTSDDFDRMITLARHVGMGIILDIVPNHMASDSSNPWWADVLLNGSASSYASFFDIDWEGGKGKLVLPLLGSPLSDAIAAGEIAVISDGEGVSVTYFDKRWPGRQVTQEITGRAVGGDRAAVSALLDAQAYRLADFREPPNYRRFFDINDLVSVRVENVDVFRASHSLVLDLVAKKQSIGLRVDHIDGLYDPAAYLRELRAAVSEDVYIVVEKILGESEVLPADWPVQGTTGYDFLAIANGLQASQSGVRKLGRAYAEFTGVRQSFGTLVRNQKARVLNTLFANELASLAGGMQTILEKDLDLASLPLEQITELLRELTARMPVYRTYATAHGMPPDGSKRVERMLADMIARHPRDRDTLGGIRSVLTLSYPDRLSPPRKDAWSAWVMRWQQISGPATAKGLEDTAFYRYNRLISLNEVGGYAEAVSPADVHRALRVRMRDWPYTMNASSTHDTKRSEDLRARLHVLSWIADDWATVVRRWSTWNARWKRPIRGQPMPDPNMEWFLYQTLVGMWPLQTAEEPGVLTRLQAFLTKAAREAKDHTSWLNVDSDYESALMEFGEAILDEDRSSRFLASLRDWVAGIAPLGAAASLAQLTLKATAPGIPDVYQGQEMWDFSLADPDNRRPVLFEERAHALDAVRAGQSWDVDGLVANWKDGRIKLLLTQRLLSARRTLPDLFLQGQYIPLAVESSAVAPEDAPFAFARRWRDDWLVVVLPRALTRLAEDGCIPLGAELGRGGHVLLPAKSPTMWEDWVTGASIRAGRSSLDMDELFAKLPVVVLRGAGNAQADNGK